MYRYGFKLLSPDGCTEMYSFEGWPAPRGQREFSVYNLPNRDQKWALTEHPDPVLLEGDKTGRYYQGAEEIPSEPGENRIHIHKFLTAEYAPHNWQAWFARIPQDHYIGSKGNKHMATGIELRRIRPDVLARGIQLVGEVRGVNLSRLSLPRQSMRRWKLIGVGLEYADFYGSQFTDCQFTDVDFSAATLAAAVFTRCTFINCQFRLTVFKGTTFQACAFQSCELTGAMDTVTFSKDCSFHGNVTDNLNLYRCTFWGTTGRLHLFRTLLNECTFNRVPLSFFESSDARFHMVRFLDWGTPKPDDPPPCTEVLDAIQADDYSCPDLTPWRAVQQSYQDILTAFLNEPIA